MGPVASAIDRGSVAMNAKHLLTHFDRIADAPDAMLRLRRFILDLAVRGKLVEQDPNDEPASELLKRIAREVTRLKKTGEFHEPKSFVPTKRSGLPFHVPSRWEWVRLIEVARVGYGFAFPANQFNSAKRGMPLIRIRDISSKDTQAHFEGSYDAAYLVKAGDYLVGMDGNFNLRRWVGRDGLLNQRVMRLNGWRCDVVPEFIKLPLQFILDHLHGGTSLTTVKHLSARQVNGIEIPLPPLAEQRRIVAKVDELMALCDRLETARKEREASRNRLTEASLARLNAPDPDPAVFQTHAVLALDNFASLTTRPDQIKALRQTILNLAVRGKLVEQDPEDEPASELLKQVELEKTRLVKMGKIRKRKTSEPTPPDSLAFELPSGWATAKFSDVLTQLQTGPFGSSLHQNDYEVGGTPVINPASMQDGKIVPVEKMAVGADTLGRLATFKLRAGDIVMGRRGEMGRCAVVTEQENGWLCGTGSLILRLPRCLYPEYLAMLIGSPYVREYLGGSAVGATMQNLNQSILLKMGIGLPPLAEQRRIVAKVEELMALCDRLEESLAGGRETRGRLRDSLLYEILSPTMN